MSPEPMGNIDVLVIGAGMTGLGVANFVQEESRRLGRPATCIVLEAEDEPGGYCRTVVQDGFVWDYSGHFFHFKDPAIEAWLRQRMPGEDIIAVQKKSYIRFAGHDIDFPFQKNIHQLPQQAFVDCLYDLFFRDETPTDGSFLAMLYAKFGRSIADKFLVPYNEKLYACELNRLDADAMGRFFPHAELKDIIANMRVADNQSYNSSFTYPRGGAMAYVRAMLRDLAPDCVRLAERVVSIDAAQKVVRTQRGAYRYRKLVSSAPLPALLRLVGRSAEAAVFTGNKVLVWNLGFDKKGPKDVHWVYFPDRDCVFYRVGFYDNIFPEQDRMSLYVEVGYASDAQVDAVAVRERILQDLRREHIVTDQALVSSHTVTLDPAYAHITKQSMAAEAAMRQAFASQDIYSVGRYGRWTYCSIEDNILEAKALAPVLVAGLS